MFSPTACNGQWTNCANAFGDNSARATAGPNKVGTWRNYGFSLGSGDVINSVEVRADFFASRTNGYLQVRVSGDGGATFGPAHQVGGNTVEQTFWIDVTSDVAWTPDKLSNTNLRVNTTCVKVGGGGNPTCNLDWIPARVNFTAYDFSVSVNPASGSVTQGGSVATTVDVTHISGNPQTVSLTQSGCPPGATCSFSPSSGTPTFSSTLTVQTNSNTTTGAYGVTIYATGGGQSRTAVYNVTVNPA